MRPLCVWDFPGKNTGVDCHFLLQGIFPDQGSNRVSCIGRQFLTAEPPGKPQYSLEGLMLILVLGPPDAKNPLIGKDLVDGQD